jgi:transcriptional regulator with XRE-family HTH domain
MGELGALLIKARSDRKLSQRDVAAATGGDVSNAYLSQLETGKIKSPSPNVLYALASALQTPYDKLMSAAGYVTLVRQPDRLPASHLYTIDHLTPAEHAELLTFLQFMRWRDRNQSHEKGSSQ